ncbi:MAG: hypothetical protein OQK05_06565 [Pseudopelagicola sp.]|nr:hypothetical protein [Pseudopelagicola sp.]
MSGFADRARLRALRQKDPVTRRIALVIWIMVGVVFLGFSGAELLLYLFSDGPETLVDVRRFRDFIGLTRDRSFAEWVNYAVAFLAAVMFFWAYMRCRAPILCVLGLLMVFILADDALQYHEVFGGYLVERFALGALPGTRPQDTGELLAWGMAGAVFAVLIGWSSRQRNKGDSGVFWAAFLPFALLAFAGIVLDIGLFAVPGRYEFVRGVVTILEEGGEMIAVALLAVTATGLARTGAGYYATSGAARTLA